MENLNMSGNKVPKELRDEKNRDSKIEEQIMKTLTGATTIDEKLNLLLKKYVESEKNNKKLNSSIKLNEKKFDVILREKDILQKEYNKGVLMRDKLEQVCREQQKLIKSVKNESLTKIREEEERRKENQAKFQDSINEINITLNKNNEENIKLKEDNIEMTKKLKYLAEQYQVREKQLQKINEQIQLESQLHDAKLAKLQMEFAIEKEILLREKQAALDDLLNCKKIIQELQSREELLKEQLNVYTTKYDDFQNSLQKSNEVFVTYKSELDKMCKNTKKLEKECVEWKKKWEKSNASLINLATEKQVKDEHIIKTTRQMNQLQKLLRALQAERNILHQVLKDNNIERPPMPVLPTEPEISLQQPSYPVQNVQSDKMERMVKNCAELKQSMAKLQGQMDAIVTKQSENAASSAKDSEAKKATKTKKSKSKNKPTGAVKEKPQFEENVHDIQEITEAAVMDITTKINEEDLTNSTDDNEIISAMKSAIISECEKEVCPENGHVEKTNINIENPALNCQEIIKPNNDCKKDLLSTSEDEPSSNIQETTNTDTSIQQSNQNTTNGETVSNVALDSISG